MTMKETENQYVKDNAMLTSADVMNILQISRATFTRLTSSGAIKGIKIGRSWRFSRESIERYMNGEPQE